MGLALQGDAVTAAFRDSVDEPQQRLARLLTGRATLSSLSSPSGSSSGSSSSPSGSSGPVPAEAAARLAATRSALLRGLSQQHALGLPPGDQDTWVRAARGVTTALLP
ncbi:hypothetical protein [Streptomyces sp. NPDC051567]|uniref:hypothetical protein n=1 Tax=Streptomyces sp. NPDC051567 TaxID=3365660 RepID=UPI00378BED3B